MNDTAGVHNLSTAEGRYWVTLYCINSIDDDHLTSAYTSSFLFMLLRVFPVLKIILNTGQDDEETGEWGVMETRLKTAAKVGQGINTGHL